ncbi:anthranilate synthase component I family protein [Echinicola marina]|uniref:anthranilate synthase component I family protein n=1 Tax=Echinicola marina TaxID=2859768 RepID=UPI001CF6182C|nr:anthranilate synthase component I family protein [Echinicola marina]UCS95627.1 anthranilate synthase component I family protein [Echinicola marina]
MKEKKRKEYPLHSGILEKSISWACENHLFLSYHNPNNIPYPKNGFDHILYAGNTAIDWNDLENYPGAKAGIFSYDLKNKFERLKSLNPPLVSCPESSVFLADLVISFKRNKIIVLHEEPDTIMGQINEFSTSYQVPLIKKITSNTTREDYIKNVKSIQNHIREGDIYELNYCIAFNAQFEHLDPLSVFLKLQYLSPMPFSSFFKSKEQYLIGASPERFIKKEGRQLTAQPIKGTIKRGQTREEDLQLQETLRHSEKERAENLMIVDLMRNDLARISDPGSVRVEELFGIYPFKQISQMISTISSTIKDNISFDQIISHTFPMGSMTGAPKIKCMELIDQYENFKRGWFSGALGYIKENGDFDLSVIIRSIIIDTNTKELFFAAGSAITYDADPAYEYDECLLKASSMFKVLNAENIS